MIGELPEKEVNRKGWSEYGTVSGRKRRAAPFDIEFARDSIKLNTPTDIAITKVDVLYPEVVGVRDFSDLSEDCQKWIEELEKRLEGIPITLIKTGPDIYDIIDLREEKHTI